MSAIYGEHSALPILSSVSCMAPGPSFRQIGLRMGDLQSIPGS